jgi:hypothetical protein
VAGNSALLSGYFAEDYDRISVHDPWLDSQIAAYCRRKE